MTLLRTGVIGLAMVAATLTPQFRLLGEPTPAATVATNRLASETSPYLLMHARNPVDWYPWGEEAFARARQENKLVFLSVGYSSCHWCHVMEHESFMDKEIAEFLNKHFICIKVDREERPDVDDIYMTAVQIVSKRGGWPMSVFLTPDAKPIFGATYFPARDGDRPGATGFLTVIQRIHPLWLNRPDDLRRDADRLTELVRTQLQPQADASPPGGPPDADWLVRVTSALQQDFDPQYGGFSFDPVNAQLPKFPEPANLQFLLARWTQLTDDQKSMVTTTLDAMAQGGMRDHFGGGFHRYSTDRYWHIPHFEKMLYDNGQLATVYAQAFAHTGQLEYRRVVEQLIEFLVAEMRAPTGGFYAALDADSEGEEGKYYRWNANEIEQHLAKPASDLIKAGYGFNEPANFEGHYVPLRRKTPDALAADGMLTLADWYNQIDQARRHLEQIRQRRPRPFTDTKIITSWNGIAIRGLADAGRLLEEPRYVALAEQAAEFLWQTARRPDGRLWRTYSIPANSVPPAAVEPNRAADSNHSLSTGGTGVAKFNAYLDDYAFLVDGFIGLHEATGKPIWLERSTELMDKQIELFHDELQGGFFFTSSDHEEMLVRGKMFFDGPLPAGNSIAASNLLYLSQHAGRNEYCELARRTIVAPAEYWRRAPQSLPRLAQAAGQWLHTQ